MITLFGSLLTLGFCISFYRHYISLYRQRNSNDLNDINNIDVIQQLALFVAFLSLVIYGYLVDSFVAVLNGGLGTLYTQSVLLLAY